MMGLLLAVLATGKPLWHKPLGGSVGTPPITWARNGRQYLTVAAGSAIQPALFQPRISISAHSSCITRCILSRN